MPKRILVVDDIQEVADTKAWIIEKLSQGEFVSEVVYGGKACLDRLSKPPVIDLVLLDMDMPMVNGADVIRTLLQMEHPPAKILPMTAWGPGWVQHWNLTELAETKAFKFWIWNSTYDKATEVEEMMGLIRSALGAQS